MVTDAVEASVLLFVAAATVTWNCHWNSSSHAAAAAAASHQAQPTSSILTVIQ